MENGNLKNGKWEMGHRKWEQKAFGGGKWDMQRGHGKWVMEMENGKWELEIRM